MLHRNFITIEKCINSTQKDEYEYLCRSSDEVKSDKITDENGGIVEHGIDFNICKKIVPENNKLFSFDVVSKKLT